MSISAQTFVTDMLHTVDSVINHFVQAGYNHLVQDNYDTITMLFTVYIALLGYRFATRSLNIDIYSIGKHLFVMLIVFGLVTNWSLYSLFFYNVFTNEPGVIAQSLVNASGNMIPPGDSTAAALNSVLSQSMEAAAALMRQGNVTNWMPWIYGFILAIVTAIYCITALFLLIYAKLALAVMLVLGPLFVLFLLWESTRSFFEKWIQALLNYALIPIITSAILMLVLSIANVLLPDLTSNINSGSPHFSGLWPYLLFCLLSALLFKQVLAICAALSAGMSLEGLGAVIPMAAQALKMTGLKAAGAKIGSKVQGYAKHKVGQIRQERQATQERIKAEKAKADSANKLWRNM